MTDAGIVGCGWVKLLKTKYSKLPDLPPYDRVSGVYECRFDAVTGLSPDSTEADEQKTKEFSKLAKLRTMIVSCIMLDSSGPRKATSISPSKPKSSKITARLKPDTTDSPEPFIAAISMVLTVSPLADDPDDKTVILTHGHHASPTLEHLPNLEVLCFKPESAMLQGFRDIFLAWDPDEYQVMISQATQYLLFSVVDSSLAWVRII